MTNTVWPKTGERWVGRNNKSDNDVLIEDVRKEQVCFCLIHDFRREQKQSDLYNLDIDQFLKNYKKSTPVATQDIIHKINVGSTTLHLAFKPESTRLSHLYVKVENPDFPTCEMEINGSLIVDPLRYLAYLVPEEVEKMMFGIRANVPDFPATAAHVIDMASTTRLGIYKFSTHEVKILRTKAYAALKEFNGNHQYACEELFEDLRDFGFHKPEDMMQTRMNPTTIEFMEDVWTPVQSYLKEEIEAGRLLFPIPDCNDSHPVASC